MKILLITPVETPDVIIWFEELLKKFGHETTMSNYKSALSDLPEDDYKIIIIVCENLGFQEIEMFSDEINCYRDLKKSLKSHQEIIRLNILECGEGEYILMPENPETLLAKLN